MLPWQCLTRYADSCRNAKFIDIDFPDLMERKRRTVLGTPELMQPLTAVEEVAGSPVLLKSEQYAQIGCDLRDVGTVQQALSSLVDVSTASFLFVAEVSITYMETSAADGVIQWAGTIGSGRRTCIQAEAKVLANCRS